VGGFKVAIDYADNRSGPTLSWEVDFTMIDGRWRSFWDFGSDGQLEFTCQDVQFVASDGEQAGTPP
jgi:hypothetical protein